MVRLVCFRQGKNLSKSLREALRSFRWDTHHIADVADLKFCLLLLSLFLWPKCERSHYSNALSIREWSAHVRSAWTLIQIADAVRK
jgi:hypothetical protein